MLADTKPEVAGLGEVPLLQLVLLDLEATLEDLLRLSATDGNVDGNLFVTADTERTDGVAGLACFLSCQSRFLAQNTVESYCRRGFDRSAARAPWPHG